MADIGLLLACRTKLFTGIGVGRVSRVTPPRGYSGTSAATSTPSIDVDVDIDILFA